MIFIKNGLLKTMAGEDYVGNLLIEDNKIKAIGKDIVAPEGAKVVDASGCLVTPGIVDGHSHLGMWLESIRFEGSNGNETSDPITPQVRALDSFNPTSECITEALDAGVTTVCICPGSANVFGGSCSVIKLVGDCIDDMIISKDMAMKCAFGENPKFFYGSNDKAPMTRMGQVAMMREMLFKAKEYDELKKLGETDPKKTPKFDSKLEALLPVVRKEIHLKAHAHRHEDILNMMRVAKEFDVKFTIEHCTEGWMIAEYLAKEGVEAFLGPLAPFSKTKYESRNRNLEAPAILNKAGMKFGLTVDAPVIPANYLLLQAGLLVKEGLDEQEAWKSVTINPAEIIGVGDRLGSLEVGKDADVVVYCGNPMTDISAHTRCVIVDGKIVKACPSCVG